MAKMKTICPISRDEFKSHAPVLEIVIGDRKFKAVPREFSTGSLG